MNLSKSFFFSASSLEICRFDTFWDMGRELEVDIFLEKPRH